MKEASFRAGQLPVSGSMRPEEVGERTLLSYSAPPRHFRCCFVFLLLCAGWISSRTGQDGERKHNAHFLSRDHGPGHRGHGHRGILGLPNCNWVCSVCWGLLFEGSKGRSTACRELFTTKTLLLTGGFETRGTIVWEAAKGHMFPAPSKTTLLSPAWAFCNSPSWPVQEFCKL